MRRAVLQPARCEGPSLREVILIRALHQEFGVRHPGGVDVFRRRTDEINQLILDATMPNMGGREVRLFPAASPQGAA